jgi:ABC-type branched-subunit amino acid transport system substrate-binding protein
MSYESEAEPIKIGVLWDFLPPKNYPPEMRLDYDRPFELIFKDARAKGVIDRPIELITRQVEGLPKGTIKAVIDAYAELVDMGCLLVFGPMITDNTVPLREEIEGRFRVPALSMTGAEDFLGEWTFSLPQGSMTDEPVFWAKMIAKRGLKAVGIVKEQSLIGAHYIANFRRASAEYGLQVVAEETIPQTAQDVRQAVLRLHQIRPDALVHAGFGFGVVHVNPALAELKWNPPRFMGTAFQNAWINQTMWNAVIGWTGLDNYDEGNLIGQAFLDRFKEAYGRRPEYCVPVMNHDFANIILTAVANARPLTPRGIKESLERIKMLPAAAGAPGTRITFGNWMHRGWVGASYLVARELEADGVNSHLVERFTDD